MQNSNMIISIFMFYYQKKGIPSENPFLFRKELFSKLRVNVKYNIELKTLLQQGISEPIFYGNLVYKLKIIFDKPNFSDQFKIR